MKTSDLVKMAKSKKTTSKANNTIKKEVTKKEDVKLVLGDPFEVGYSSGQPTWTYGLYQYRLFGDTHTKELKLYWSRNGVIERYSFSSSFPQDVNRAESSLNQGSQVAPK